MSREKFGKFDHREREARELGLRGMAKMTELAQPMKAIAQIIGCDADELLARADRVATDLSDIIKQHPVELAALLRTTKGLTSEDIARLARNAQKAKDK